MPSPFLSLLSVLEVMKEKKYRLISGYGRSVIVRQNCNRSTVNELQIIIFELNYLTVLVYTKTIIHLSVCG